MRPVRAIGAALFSAGALTHAAPASAAVDFDIVSVERNQVVQSINNDIPMVLGKAIGVRVHVRGNGTKSSAIDGGYTIGAAKLDVYRGSTYLTTLNPVGSSTIRVVPTTASNTTVVTNSRYSISRSFNFMLGESLQSASGITIVASINNNHAVAETSYSNNTETRNISFVQTTNLKIHGRLFSSPQHPCSGAVWADFGEQVLRVLRMYPVDAIQLYGQGQCSHYDKKITTGAVDDDYYPGSPKVIGDADTARMGGSNPDRHWYVLAPWDHCECGYGYLFTPGASVGTNNGGTHSDRRDTAALGLVMAHELGHGHGRNHMVDGHPLGAGYGPFDTTCCHHSSINGVYETTIGLDPLSMTLYLPGAHGTPGPHDFMSYTAGTTRWISDYTYLAILNKRKIAAGAARAQIAQSPSRSSHLVLAGAVAPTPRLDPAYVLDLAGVPAARPGDYALDLLDAGGGVLATHSFALREASEGEGGGFSEAVPNDPAVRSVNLRTGSTVLATLQRSQNAPTLSILTPKPGVHWAGAKTVTWDAADADGDAMRYIVQYSADGGKSWLTVGSDLTERKLDIDASVLEGSRDCRVRVIATDGLNTTVAVSAPFGVDPHNPVAKILQALPVGSGALSLAASATDADDGELAARQIVWASHRDGRLGIGERITTAQLSRGRHRITLTVTDASGNRATATKSVKVRRAGPRPPRSARARGRQVSWKASARGVAAFIVQRARGKAREFTTVARVHRAERSYSDPSSRASDRYRVAACSARGACSEFTQARR